MTDKQLKKLKRVELLEIMHMQSQKIEELEAKLADAESQLADRQIVLDEAGSIAEAALRLNDIFAAAQKAADQYVESVKAQYEAK